MGTTTSNQKTRDVIKGQQHVKFTEIATTSSHLKLRTGGQHDGVQRDGVRQHSNVICSSSLASKLIRFGKSVSSYYLATIQAATVQMQLQLDFKIQASQRPCKRSSSSKQNENTDMIQQPTYSIAPTSSSNQINISSKSRLLASITSHPKTSNKTSFGQLISNFIQQQGSRVPSIKQAQNATIKGGRGQGGEQIRWEQKKAEGCVRLGRIRPPWLGRFER
ncbi:hypothetical protein ACLOJK_015226 [Asimina triloba]